MDKPSRARLRMLALFLPLTAVLYIGAEALDPKGTDQVINTTPVAFQVLPIAASHSAQLYVSGSLSLAALGALAVSYAAIAALVAQRPGLVLVGPFVRNGKTSVMQRLLLRMAMAPPWAAISWKSYPPKLYAGRRPADFGEYRDQVVASLRRPGYAKAFSRTTRTSHDPAEARLADITAPALVVMGEQDPDFPDPRAEADWIARALRAQVVMVPEAGHYPQSQRSDITTGAVLRFLESVTGRA